MNRSLLILALLLSYLFSTSQQNLKETRKLLSGDWSYEERIDFFSFKNDSSGVWSTIGKHNDTPLFVIRSRDSHLYIIPMTEEGEKKDPIEIRSLDEKKLVLYYPATKDKLVFKKATQASD